MDSRNSLISTHNCDLCGSAEYTPLEVARPYIGGQEPPVVCKGCGFVYVRERRSSEAIIASWKELYESGAYDPKWPGVRARLFYVAEWIDQKHGLTGKRLLDYGAGDGYFVYECENRGAEAYGYEPTTELGSALVKTDAKFDFVTINWTLENCGDCIALMKDARRLLKPDGHIIVATGSRIKVPPRKWLSTYFSKNPADTHCFRWTPNSLSRAFMCAGFEPPSFNDYQQNDVLLAAAVIAKPGDTGYPTPNEHDSVLAFFDQWATQWP